MAKTRDLPPGVAELEKLHKAISKAGGVEPVPLPDNRPPPPFPLHALPDLLRQFAVELAEEVQAPVDMPAMLVLAALALACSKKAKVCPMGNWSEPLSLFLMIAMRSGSRKSAMFARVLAAVLEFERSEWKRLAPLRDDAESKARVLDKRIKKLEQRAAEGQKKEDRDGAQVELDLARKERAEVVVPEMTRLVADDVTMEALADLLSKQGGRMGIFAPEARKLLSIIGGKYNQKGTADHDVLLKGHAGEDLIIDRVNRGATYIPKATLTLALMAQPTVLRKLCDMDDGSGLAARFAYVLPEPPPPSAENLNPPVMQQQTEAGFARVVRKLLEWELDYWPDGAIRERRLELNSEARDVLNEFRRTVNLRRSPGGDFANDPRALEWSAKLAGLVVRIGALLHLADNATSENPAALPVTGTAMRAAVEIGEYLAAHALRAFGLMREDDAWEGAKAIFQWLQARRKTEFCESELLATGPKPWRKQKELREAIQVLEEREIAVVVRDPGSGQPPKHNRRYLLTITTASALEAANSADAEVIAS